MIPAVEVATDNLEEDLPSYELHRERPTPTLQKLRVESVTVLKHVSMAWGNIEGAMARILQTLLKLKDTMRQTEMPELLNQSEVSSCG